MKYIIHLLKSEKFCTYFFFIIIFISISLTFLFLELNPRLTYFADNDSFYHVAMAKQMMQEGIIQKFPQLYYSTLNENFVDYYLLFHLGLIPFIKIFGDVLGPKIMVSLFVGLIFAVVYLILKDRKLRLSPLYAVLIFLIMPPDFYHRLSYIRGSSLSLFFIVLLIYYFYKNRPLAFGFTSLFFVYSYYFFSPIIIVFLLISFFIQLFGQEKVDWRFVIYGLGGLLFGLVVNPYFYKNIILLYSQIFESGLNAKPYSGTEWLPSSTWNWFYASLVPITLFCTGLYITLIKNIKQDSKIVVLFLLTLAVLVMQWKSVRFVEYWPVLGALCGLLLIGKYFEEAILNAKVNWKKKEFWAVLILVCFIIQESLIHSFTDIPNVYKEVNRNYASIADIKAVSEYLNNNAKEKDIIFNDRWDNFPYYYYFSPSHYYIIGLEVEFMRINNPELFRKYLNLANLGNNNIYIEYRDTNTGVSSIKSDFKANWVIVSPTDQALNNEIIKKSDMFEKNFDSNGYIVYKVL